MAEANMESTSTTMSGSATTPGSASGSIFEQASAGIDTPQADPNGQQADSEQQTAEPGAPQQKPDEPVVPEKYEFTPPEGLALDEALVAEVEPMLKKFKATQEEATTINGWGHKLIDQGRQIGRADVEREIALETQENEKALQADPELGGANMPTTLKNVGKAMRMFATHLPPEAYNGLLQAVEKRGLGSDPALVRAFNLIGMHVEDNGSFLAGNQPVNEPKSQAERMYPHLKAG